MSSTPKHCSGAPIRVMTVDDSPVARRLVERVLLRAGFDVVAELSDGEMVTATAKRERADIVVLDLEMPQRSGHEVVEDLLSSGLSVGVVIYSGASKGSLSELEESLARRLPCRVVSKGAGAGGGIEGLSERLVPLVQELGEVVRQRSEGSATAMLRARVKVAEPPAKEPVEPPPECAIKQPQRSASAADFDLLVIGASTGGPEALLQVLRELPADFALPIAIVQHMPVGFTQQLAKRLDSQCAIQVREAASGETLQAGCAFIAPGGEHLEVRSSGTQLKTRLSSAPPENSCRPAVDVLFRAAAGLRNSRVLAVVLTGMGHDGLAGIEQIRSREGWSIAQDEATSVVWGMPGAVVKAGQADEVLPLEAIGKRLIEHVKPDRSNRRVG